MFDYVILAAVGAACGVLGAFVSWRLKRRSCQLEVEEAVNTATEAAAEKARQEGAQQLALAGREAEAQYRRSQLTLGEIAHWAERRLPAVVQELAGATVQSIPALLHGDAFKGSELAGYLTAAETQLRETVLGVRRRAQDSAQSTVRAAAEEMQAAAMRAQRDVDEAHDQVQDDRLRGDSQLVPRILAKIDHSVTLAGHTAQRLRVLAHSWPGVQRANCSVAEIVESAQGRIERMDRVDYTFHPETADVQVEGLVVEPVIIALTELLANATSYSGDTVSIYAQRMQSGMRITVEDKGLGMDALQLEEAERSLSASADVSALNEPYKLGFLVIAKLAETYGLRVGLLPSASGGVRADLLIPAERLATDGPAAEPRRGTAAGGLAWGPASLQETANSSGPIPGTGLVPANAPMGGSASGDGLPRAADGGPVPAVPDGLAEPSGVGGTPSLPKRQPRRPIRRAAPVTDQQDFADPDTFAARLGDIGSILDGFSAGHDHEG